MNVVKILVATDGSDPALRACRTLVTELRPVDGAEVRVLNVVSFSLYPYPLTDYGLLSDSSEREREVETVVERATRPTVDLFEDAGYKVEVVHRFGNAADETLAEISEWEPSLVILGKRGLGPIGRLLGSVSERILHQTKVPVLVAP